VIFTYCPYRNTETLQQLLEGFWGKLVTDGLDLYDSYADLKKLVHGLCKAHSRRGFEEARQTAAGDAKKSKSTSAQPKSAAAHARSGRSGGSSPERLVLCAHHGGLQELAGRVATEGLARGQAR
jgi:hypothetical protein